MEILRILNIFNICFYSFGLILTILIAVAVCYLKLYHGNLRFLLLNVSFTHCFMLITALTCEISDLFKIQFQARAIVNHLTSLCLWATIFNMLCLLCERIAASFYDKKYETMCNGIPWLGILLALVDWGVAFLFNFLIIIKVVTSSELAISIIVVDAIALITFSFMPSLTYKRYMHVSAQTKDFSLSQRYQMSENYRSAKLLTTVVWCFGVLTMLGAVCYIFSRRGPCPLVFQFFYAFSFASHAVVYPFLVMFFETKVRDFIFFNKNNRIFIAKSITGKDLIISNVNEQREAYFKSYEQAWA